jgi:hypothetical protein
MRVPDSHFAMCKGSHYDTLEFFDAKTDNLPNLRATRQKRKK